MAKGVAIYPPTLSVASELWQLARETGQGGVGVRFWVEIRVGLRVRVRIESLGLGLGLGLGWRAWGWG